MNRIDDLAGMWMPVLLASVSAAPPPFSARSAGV